MIPSVVTTRSHSFKYKIVFGNPFSEFKSIYPVFIIIGFFYRIYAVSSIKDIGIVTFIASKGIVTGVTRYQIISAGSSQIIV